MKLIHASYEIMTPINAKDIYQMLEKAGRTCYKSEDKITEESAEKFVRAIVKRGHEAMLEHASLTVRFIVDRGVSHELVRHRIASFAQESTRYCVAGDSLLTFKNPHIHMSISDLYNNMINSSNGSWKRMQIRQYNEKTGELGFSKIKNIFYNGKKPCYKIKTALKYELTCTGDHEIFTPSGYRKVNDLQDGDNIYVNGSTMLYTNYDWLYYQNIVLNKTFVQIAKEFGFAASTLKKWARKLKIPKKGTGYFHISHTPWNKGITDERQANALRQYHHCGRRKEGIMKQDTVNYQKHKIGICEICGCKDKSTLEVHHINSDHGYNDPSNLMTVCESCHQRIHSQNLLTIYPDKIISIEPVGEIDVYDIEMNSDYHNYVANGVVVHNCNYSQDKFGNELTFIRPAWHIDFPGYVVWHEAMKNAEKAYFDMLASGCTPEEARSVLPNSLKTEVIMTCNLREMRHFLKLRAAGVTGKPHPQMLEVAVPLLNELREKLPAVFEDILPMEETK